MHAASGMNQSRGVIHLYITTLHKYTKRDQNITKNNLTLVTCLVVLSNNNSRRGCYGSTSREIEHLRLFIEFS